MRDRNPYRVTNADAAINPQGPLNPTPSIVETLVAVGIGTTVAAWLVMQVNYLSNPVPNLWDDALVASVFYMIAYIAVIPFGLLLSKTLGAVAISVFNIFAFIALCLSSLAFTMTIHEWTGPVRVFP